MLKLPQKWAGNTPKSAGNAENVGKTGNTRNYPKLPQKPAGNAQNPPRLAGNTWECVKNNQEHPKAPEIPQKAAGNS